MTGRTKYITTAQRVCQRLMGFLPLFLILFFTQLTMADSPATMPSASHQLHAGPISLKFEDGELRYLYVGQKEIIRRIYFGVRDGSWNTAAPKFAVMQVDDGGDHFTVKLNAVCKMDKVDYKWEGTITGTADGKITFAAVGAPQIDFASNRIGLCVIYGAPSLKGQTFETLDATGTAKKAEFPQLVQNKLVADRFQTLRYTTADGIQVSCGVTGATFDMEDQRNWGDSSFKAYAPLRYKYPNVKTGERQQQALAIVVTQSAPPGKFKPGVVNMKLTDTVIGKLPKFESSVQFRNAVAFQDISFSRERYTGAKAVIWLYVPTVHLIDNDVIMENVPTICDQAKTVKTFAPDAVLHVGAALRAPKADEGRDPRAATPFGAAWAAAMVKYVSCSNVDDAAFDLGPGYATQVIDALRPYTGKEVLDVRADHDLPLSPTAFAFKDEKGTVVWISNRSAEPAEVVLEGLGSATTAKVTHIDGHLKPDSPMTDQDASFDAGQLTLELAGYGVARVVVGK